MIMIFFLFQASSANFWASKVGKDKLMVGFPFYCHAYKLLSPLMHGYHAFSDGKGECDFGKYTCVSNKFNKTYMSFLSAILN